jgi:hypothetical protein
LAQVLPFIKIKESILSSIPKAMERELNAKENKNEVKRLYDHFKKYSYHHVGTTSKPISTTSPP